MSQRDIQKEQRRQLIISAALELFAIKGYSDTKIGDIAKAANMSVGLMFHYFESKEQLYEELVRMGVNGMNAPLNTGFETSLEYFTKFLEALFQYVKEQPKVLYMFVLMGQARRSDSIPQHIKELAMSVDQIGQSADIIAAGQQYGFFREGDPQALSFAFWSSVQGIMEQLALSPERQALPEPEWLIDIIRGIRA